MFCMSEKRSSSSLRSMLFGRDSHMDVDGRNRVRQSADRNIVDSGFRIGSHVPNSDSAGAFERDAAGRDFRSLFGLFRTEVVEEDDIGPRVDYVEKFIKVVDLDFDLHKVTKMPACRADRMCRTRLKCEVVVL